MAERLVLCDVNCAAGDPPPCSAEADNEPHDAALFPFSIFSARNFFFSLRQVSTTTLLVPLLQSTSYALVPARSVSRGSLTIGNFFIQCSRPFSPKPSFIFRPRCTSRNLCPRCSRFLFPPFQVSPASLKFPWPRLSPGAVTVLSNNGFFSSFFTLVMFCSFPPSPAFRKDLF